MAADKHTDVEYGHRLHPLLHFIAPIVTMGAVWGARELINRSYERVSGRTPPIPSDPETSWRRALIWTAVTTTTAAVIEVSVHRLANERQIVKRMRAQALERAPGG